MEPTKRAAAERNSRSTQNRQCTQAKLCGSTLKAVLVQYTHQPLKDEKQVTLQQANGNGGAHYLAADYGEVERIVRDLLSR
jgi:hypothetical protein